MSDEQRATFIDLMTLEGDDYQITIRDAASLSQINYESAKSIWQVYKNSGRKHKASNKLTHTPAITTQQNLNFLNPVSSSDLPILQRFDLHSTLLAQADAKLTRENEND